ncbi:UbiA family prenyltransferase [Streptomyces rapamycinicus NRRL 5491]|uniref:UbiA prenyltransferase n=2 Tax=Streptomyces rapamycinicus TaxID=1226757 RepID=A0A3L8R2L5_STRRN|nr:UbiA family prenyltransferase [Streptomyces rapamycinicus]MBB4781618.1 4-hydroxybenzoate polyprenyltransferase [Streptomyces rapamycinicus]RLV73740.1 UbiA prenyltransferase [Streptomyces rapamycinicus NRRL 5491]UTO62202.1 UbiA family prenyltransferase [Streptomyces rapamycinicus]UTP30156.1 UbiA family prenyltransferase [Streptomyces rapamycinicus NRRL 5491]
MTAEAGERGPLGKWGDWAELLRVSALFTVPGDALAGAAAARRGPNRGTALAVCASLCLYEAGMALNDWADRDIDAVERPGRPLPSGRIAPAAALTAATGLTAAGLLCAAAAGRPALTTATALAGTVWAYDLGLKNTPAGPPTMAAARALDLLLGATASAGHIRPALRPAALLGAHTLAVTTVSRHEAVGGSSTAPLGALATGAAIAWAATRRPAPASERGPEAGHGAPVAGANGATTPSRRGTPAGDPATGGAAAALTRELSRAGLRRGGPARRLAGALAAPAPSGRGNRPGRRWVPRRALAQLGRLPAVGRVSRSGRGPSGGAAVGRTVTSMRSRSAAARHMAATVRADASPKAAASAPAVVQGAVAAVTQGLAHARRTGAGARRGGPAARLVAAATAATRHAAPPGGTRAGAAMPRRTGIPSPGAAVSRFAAVVQRTTAAVTHELARGKGVRAGRGGPARRLVAAATGGGPPDGPRAGAGAPLTIPSRGAAVSRFAAVAGVALAGGYVATVARPLAHAALNPSPYLLQRAVGSGIRAMIPLQAVLASRAGAHRTAAGLLALMPVARRLSRKVSAT